MKNNLWLDEIIDRGLKEDIHYRDITSELLIDENQRSKARFLFKEEGVLCGVAAIDRVFHRLCPNDFVVTYYHNEGDVLAKGTVFAEIEGPTQALLMGERLTLNLLQRMSGVATLSRAYAQTVKDLGTVQSSLSSSGSTAVSFDNRHHSVNLGTKLPVSHDLVGVLIL